MAGLSLVIFLVIFTTTFPTDLFASDIKFQTCTDLSWFHPSYNCSSDHIGSVIGKIDVIKAIEHSAYEW
ncbi:hypothetical protein Bca4012_011268 [Brassica carinata]